MQGLFYGSFIESRSVTMQLSIHEVSQKLNLSIDTIRRWEKKGLIKAERSDKNHRIFDEDEVKALLKKLNDKSEAEFKVLKNKTPSPYTAIELFAGAGGTALGFENAGIHHVLLNEFDKNCVETLRNNFPKGTNIVHADIHNVDFSSWKGKVDIVQAGFPCQAFSIMGKMQGFADTRGTMFFEIERILSYHKPPVILLENVKQLTTHDKGRTFKVILSRLAALGYFVKWKVLNALDFGLPQKRERVIIVGFRSEQDFFDFNFDFSVRKYNLADILEKDNEVDKSLFASEKIVQKRLESTKGKEVFYPSIWHENKSGNISVLDYACALRTGASYNYLLVNGYRRPSSRELLRLQGFPDSYKIVVSHQEIRRQTGNSVAVPMIRAIARKINNIIKKEYNETA